MASIKYIIIEDPSTGCVGLGINHSTELTNFVFKHAIIINILRVWVH